MKELIVKTCVLRAAGTNCDRETAYAFERAGARSEIIHINQFVSRTRTLNEFHILAIPGGFTYGDDVSSGKILANELKYNLFDDIRRFVEQGRLIIGICNGFQVLVKSGLLPDVAGDCEIEASLVLNNSGKFEDCWVYLKPPRPITRCVWTNGIERVIYLPVAHGEGKFVVKGNTVLSLLKENNQIVFRYCTPDGSPGPFPVNPNGSLDDIAGICDPTGRILGMMPHPERHITFFHHPHWHRCSERKQGDGLNIFENGVQYIQKTILTQESGDISQVADNANIKNQMSK
ncbi:MAG: phosphoribosylformylglycinamidine synthase I [Candidatus Omnitrophica bacterium]|nr:phosphoribosylformylglycinamidine synthase I [Candidatus Omnitrophota bacterium]